LTDDAGALAAIETSNTPVFVVRYETSDAGAFVPRGAFGVRHWLVPPEGPEREDEARADADRFLARLSAGTGGRLLAAQPDADLAEMLTHIGNELSNQAVIAYYPSNATLDGRYRRIRVTVDCEGCAVRARRGYRAGAIQ
jgi:VWFA-related protein